MGAPIFFPKTSARPVGDSGADLGIAHMILTMTGAAIGAEKNIAENGRFIHSKNMARGAQFAHTVTIKNAMG
jgi:hypothetical protein